MKDLSDIGRDETLHQKNDVDEEAFETEVKARTMATTMPKQWLIKNFFFHRPEEVEFNVTFCCFYSIREMT